MVSVINVGRSRSISGSSGFSKIVTGSAHLFVSYTGTDIFLKRSGSELMQWCGRYRIRINPPQWAQWQKQFNYPLKLSCSCHWLANRRDVSVIKKGKAAVIRSENVMVSNCGSGSGESLTMHFERDGSNKANSYPTLFLYRYDL